MTLTSMEAVRSLAHSRLLAISEHHRLTQI